MGLLTKHLKYLNKARNIRQPIGRVPKLEKNRVILSLKSDKKRLYTPGDREV